MQIATALKTALDIFEPTYLSLDNESHQHAGYFDGKESHFRLVIVSEQFVGKRLTARHQAVYAQVAPLLVSGGGSVHALALFAYTPSEWADQQTAPQSPNCAGQHRP